MNQDQIEELIDRFNLKPIAGIIIALIVLGSGIVAWYHNYNWVFVVVSTIFSILFLWAKRKYAFDLVEGIINIFKKKSKVGDYFIGIWKSEYQEPGQPKSGAHSIEIKNNNEWWEDRKHLWNIENFSFHKKTQSKEEHIVFTKTHPKNKLVTKRNVLLIIKPGEHYKGYEENNGKLEISYLFISNTSAYLISKQSYQMEIENCIADLTTIAFDVYVKNTGTLPLQFNSCVIRLTHSDEILSSERTNEIEFKFIENSQSFFPNSFPPNSRPTFSYSKAVRQFQVSTGTSLYLNGNGTAPNILPGSSKKIGRFALKNLSNNFNRGAKVNLKWAQSASTIFYIDGSTVTYSNLEKKLINPTEVRIL